MSLKFINCGHLLSPSSSLRLYNPKTMWGDLQTSQLCRFLYFSRYLQRTKAHYLTHPLSWLSNILYSFSALNLRSKQGSCGAWMSHVNSFYLNQFCCLFPFGLSCDWHFKIYVYFSQLFYKMQYFESMWTSYSPSTQYIDVSLAANYTKLCIIYTATCSCNMQLQSYILYILQNYIYYMQLLKYM